MVFMFVFILVFVLVFIFAEGWGVLRANKINYFNKDEIYDKYFFTRTKESAKRGTNKFNKILSAGAISYKRTLFLDNS